MNAMQVITVFLKTARFLGICSKQNPTCLSRFYQVFIFFTTFFISVVSIYINCKLNSAYISPVHIFIDLFSSIFITATAVSIRITFLLYTSSWTELLREVYLAGNGKHSSNTIICVYLKCLLISFLFVARIVWSYYIVTVAMSWEFNYYYMHRYINEYCVVIAIALLLYINWAIKIRIRCIRDILLNGFTICDRNLYLYHIKQCEKSYKRLLLLLKHLNYIFGYPVIFLIGYCIILMLENLRNTLTHRVGLAISLSHSILVVTFILVF